MIAIDESSLHLSKAWILPNYAHLKGQLNTLEFNRLTQGKVTIDGSAIEQFDTNGALLIQTLIKKLKRAGYSYQLSGFKETDYDLIQYIMGLDFEPEAYYHAEMAAAEEKQESLLTTVGKRSVNGINEQITFLAFFGRVALALFGKLLKPWQIRWTPFWANLQTAGVMALPIIGLLNFLIGLVITYQGGTLLQMFGMNIFAVHLVTISTLRVLGPLLTAIIVAGRTGSAYAAQIGTMVVNEEVDALKTFGIDEIDQLVIPKVLALIVALPFLTLFADMSAIFGGMVYSTIYLDISFSEFIEQIPQVVTINSLMVSLIQAPIFAIIIVLVGCYQGFRVRGGADSVGTQTTKAVVQAIFLVIIFEAIFSIITRNIPL